MMDAVMRNMKMCSMDYCLRVSDEVVMIDSVCEFSDMDTDTTHPSFMTLEEYGLMDEPIKNLIERFLR